MDEVVAGAGVEECASRHGLPTHVLRSALEDPDFRNNTLAAGTRIKRASAAWRRKLNLEQESELHALVRSHLPNDLGLKDLLWNRNALAALTEERTGFRLPQRTLTTYMERWGFAPEKPLKSLFHQQPAAMRDWMRHDYPVIAMQAREAFAVLAWWSSVPLMARERSRSVSERRLWANPELRIMFAVTNRGHSHWRIHDGATHQEQLIDFMERLVASTDRPISLIVRDQPLFSTPALIEWSLRNRQRIVINLLPALFNTTVAGHERK